MSQDRVRVDHEPIRSDDRTGEGRSHVPRHIIGVAAEATWIDAPSRVGSDPRHSGTCRVPPPPPADREASYAVVDVETTGLSVASGDRIIEIGVVVTNGAGRLDYEWTTLLSTDHDPGPTRLHGITNAMLDDAPTFADVSDDLAHVLRGRTLVAHNARFDVSFLTAEWQRVGHHFAPAWLCTMAGARSAGLPGSLSECCLRLGIDTGVEHHALDDARATALLLAHLHDPARPRPGTGIDPVEPGWRLSDWSGRDLTERRDGGVGRDVYQRR